MTIRDLLETAQCNYIDICGRYKHGLTDLYKGEIKPLIEILKTNDILRRKNWGGIDEEKCFLLMNVVSVSGTNKGLWASVTMPDSYTGEDAEGNRLTTSL